MAWIGAALSIGGSLLSSSMQGDAAEDAASAQEKGTAEALAEQRRQYDLSRGDLLAQNKLSREDLLAQIERSRTDLAPWREAGSDAVNRLSQLMGRKRSPDSFKSTVDKEKFKAAGQKARELGAVTSENFNAERYLEANPDVAAHSTYGSDPLAHFNNFGASEGRKQYVDVEGKPTYDDAGYAAAVAKERADWDAAQAKTEADPDFGSLTKPIPYENVAAAKKFTLADFWDDPVTKASYQQGLDQGTKALTNMAGARGGLNSGATLKALARFGIDYTGNQAAGSEGRFTRNETDIYNRGVSRSDAAYNREGARRDSLFNRFSAIAGTGQTATRDTVTNNANTTGTIANIGARTEGTLALIGANNANTISNLLSAQGNARGAAAIAGGNARSGGLQNAGNTLSNWWNRQNNAGGGSSVNYSNYDSYNDPWGGP